MHWRLRQLPGSMKNILHAHNHEAEDKNDSSRTALARRQGRTLLSVRIIWSQKSSCGPQVSGVFCFGIQISGFHFAPLSFKDVIKQPCSRAFNLCKPVTCNSLTYIPIKELCSLSVVIKYKTPLKRDFLCFSAKGTWDERGCLLNIILKHCVK